MLRHVGLLAALGALVISSLAVSPSRGAAQDDTARARTEFQRGVELFQGSDYQRALDAFQEAYRLAPHASVRLNIANCYEQLGRPVEALFHFEHSTISRRPITPRPLSGVRSRPRSVVCADRSGRSRSRSRRTGRPSRSTRPISAARR
jgi:tetratricopeptide (TPR) repeat protein